MRSVSVVQTTAGLTKYRYTNAGRIKEIITQNGIRTSYDYDEDGNVSRLTIGDGTEEGLLYDAFLLYDLNGNRTGKSGSRFSAAGTKEEMAVTYRYDSMNRLANEDRNGAGERYAYDLCGNRLLKEQYSGSSVDAAEGYRYNERNELTERIKAGTLTTCRYDRNGSIVSEEQEGRKSEYRYDLLNRQTYVKTLDGREQENFYDGEGLRAGMTENGRKTTFLYHNGEILAECDGESAPIRRYLRGIGLSQVQTLDDNVFHSCHQDEQGSTAYITGQGRETENSYQYDAFGNLIERKEAITNRILYTGQQYDQETGQYYLRARYYNPVVGRFLQEDTYRGDGLNLYAYCANNPVMYYDPSGHSIKSWFENLCKKVAENSGDETPGNQAVNGDGRKTYTVDPVMQAKDIETGVLIDGAYIKNPTAKNISDLIKPGSNYVGNSKMNGQFMYVVDMNGNIVIGSRAGQHMPHPTLIGGTNPTVQGAGIVEIRGGKIYSMDNSSGHFKPDSNCMTSAQNAFGQLPSNVFHKDFQGYSIFGD